MNYYRIYERLIEKRRNEPLVKGGDVYCERHHFIPKCMGGTNDTWNLVNLTAKEHFIAHHLLYKMNPTNESIMSAFMAMCASNSLQKRPKLLSARRHGVLREVYSKKKVAIFAAMTPEQKKKRNANIRSGCAKRSPEATALKVERWKQSYKNRSEKAKQESLAKRRNTEQSRSDERKLEIFQTLSKAHRKMTEEQELRVIQEYKSGKTALEISELDWCELGREGVNFLLRRRGVKNHIEAVWEGREKALCNDYLANKYPTRDALAKAYGSSWSVVKRVLAKNGCDVSPINPKKAIAMYERESRRLMGIYVTYSSPFSRMSTTSSLFDALARLNMFGLIPKKDTRRVALRKIRAALSGQVKFAYGYTWEKAITPHISNMFRP